MYGFDVDEGELAVIQAPKPELQSIRAACKQPTFPKRNLLDIALS